MANWQLTEIEEGVITNALQLLYEQAENKLQQKLGDIETRLMIEQKQQAFNLLLKFEQ